MITGRRRRYFGYPKDLTGYIDTPDSARSYVTQNRLSLSQNAKRPESCIPESFRTVTPDPKLPKRYADRHLQKAIATHIPALLPPLKNTYNFKEFEDQPINFHNPHLEHQFERSLYYIWLAKNDRSELCRIVDAHLGSHKKVQRHSGMRVPHFDDYREIGNPIQRPLDQADYSKMPRTMSILDTGIMNTKFQKTISDPPKTPRARFVRDHGKCPAMEAICHAYPVNQRTRVTERDIEDCVLAAKKLLGPYAGLDTSFLRSDDVPSDFSLLIEENNRNAKVDEDRKKSDGIVKRSFGYNSRQAWYDKQISVAMDFYNKLKSGEKNLVPPPELFKHVGKSRRKSFLQNIRKSMKESVTSMSAKLDRQNSNWSVGSKRHTEFEETTDEEGFTNPSGKKFSVYGKTRKDANEKETKRRFDANNATEQDYMDFYLHYLDENEDFTIPKPKRSLTDVRKLRNQINVDKSLETEIDRKINELIKTDSFTELKYPTARRFVRGLIDLPRNKNGIESDGVGNPDDMQVIEDILHAHYNKIKDPKVKQLYKYFASTPSAILRRALPDMGTTKVAEPSESSEQLELELGFLDIPPEHLKEFQELLSRPSMRKSRMNSEDDSDTDAGSSNSSHKETRHTALGEECNVRDIECLEEAGALGTPPFKTTILNNYHLLDRDDSKLELPEEHDRENIATNIFSTQYWKK